MIRLAKLEDLNEIMPIVEEIRKEVMENDMLKWDEDYPTREMFTEDIHHKDLYVVTKEQRIIGFACINDHEHKEFQDIKWANKGLVVHRLGIKAEYRQHGYGQQLIEYAHDLAKKRDYLDLKCCIYERNYKSENLFKKMGFRYIGAIQLPEYEGDFYCYEKTGPF